MADRIQMRRDTKARWEQYNPVLLEGEVGIVTDDPNLYKVGNGTSAWNSLPYRGFNGTVTPTITDEENTVPSNKAVSEVINTVSYEAIDTKRTATGSTPSVYKVVVGDKVVGTLFVSQSEKTGAVAQTMITQYALVDGALDTTIANNDIGIYKRIYTSSWSAWEQIEGKVLQDKGDSSLYPMSQKATVDALKVYYDTLFDRNGNLVNKENKIIQGQNANGVLLRRNGNIQSTSSNHAITDFIPVFGLDKFFFAGKLDPQPIDTAICFYNENKEFISSIFVVNNITTNNYTIQDEEIDVPEGAYYVRATTVCFYEGYYTPDFDKKFKITLPNYSTGEDAYKRINSNIHTNIFERISEKNNMHLNDYPYDNSDSNFVNLNSPLISNVSKSLVATSGEIEKEAVKIEVTAIGSLGWNFFFTKSFGVRKAGKYTTFVKVKKDANCSGKADIYVFTTGGVIIANKLLSASITEEYRIFALEFTLDADKPLYIGLARNNLYTFASVGDIYYISLIGLVPNRKENEIGDVIYTYNDLKTLITDGIDNDFFYIESAKSVLFQGIPIVGIIGDSLASGSTYDPSVSSGNLKDREGFEWWRVLERESGAKYIDLASGGQSTQSWISSFLSKALLPENKCCAYIVGLGVNDAYSLGDSYLGSSSDIDTNNSDNNANSYYGNYAKIIQKLTTNNPKCKFFLLTEPRKTGENDTKWNGAIRYIANLFSNCFLVDLQKLYNDEYTKNNGFIAGTMGPQAHYPYITYCYMAKLIEKAIGDVIYANPLAFRDIQFAVENN